MGNPSSSTVWTIDLTAGVATRGHFRVGFDPILADGLRLTFLQGGDISLAGQCLMAGEAIEAITVKLGRR